MSDLIIDRPGVKTMFKYGPVYCVLDGEGYAVFVIDRESGQQQMYGQITFSPYKAWEMFWQKVDQVMMERLESKFGPAVGGLWADPDEPGKYITNLRSTIINKEYRQRCADLNGRYDSPLSEEDRWKFEIDMLNKYGEHYPVPPALRWRVEAIKIQHNMAEHKKRHPQQVG